MFTLALETSGPVGSVALLEAGDVLEEQTLELGRQHGQSLIPAIRQLLVACGKKPRDCELVAVSIGPGSYTGLRVGIVCAKTLAYAIPCQLAGVDTLHAIACNAPAEVSAVEIVSDAQRGDLFRGRYARTTGGAWVPRQKVEVVSGEAWAAALRAEDIVSGPALEKLARLVNGRCGVLPPELRVPWAASIGRLGILAAQAGDRADPWSVEPLYLRRSSAEVQWEKLHPLPFPSE